MEKIGELIEKLKTKIGEYEMNKKENEKRKREEAGEKEWIGTKSDQIEEMIRYNEEIQEVIEEMKTELNEMEYQYQKEREEQRRQLNEMIETVTDIIKNETTEGKNESEKERREKENLYERIEWERMKKREDKWIKKIEQEMRIMKSVIEEKNKQKKRRRIEEMSENVQNALKEVGSWIQKKAVGVIFDGKIDDWNRYTSTFCREICDKKELLIVIESARGIVIGQYIDVKIEKEKLELTHTTPERWIEDPNSFLFRYYNGRYDCYEMKNGSTKALLIYDELYYVLMTFGNDDVIIFKKDDTIYSRITTEVEKNYYYDEKNMLLPLEGRYLSIDELLVFQMN